MNKMIKKLFVSILAMATIMTSNITIFASNSIAINNKSIITQATELDNTGKVLGKEFSIVSMQQDDMGVTRNLDNTNSKKVIQSLSEENGLVEVITIVPYKQLPTGELINSFEYVPVQPRVTESVPTNFVDVTVTVISYYASEFSWQNFENFYRHSGIEVYWSSNNSTANVSSLYVNYDSKGDAYKYPECMTEDLESTFVESDYFIRSVVSVNNPTKNQIYSDANNSMPLNRMLRLTNAFEHGGLIHIDMTYTVNNRTYSDESSYFIYEK